ncbi:hypothetical protein BT67DRAFT_150645 [Trichocladium antarcticum]|uniref:Uncharacterized protein n=1 Tax=Trichocladium antarcticum TaxID=1450529 RepID=A0AAN6ZBF1_9PEZI|nr:hypothetical protein BT67DRAFT_150645 [Trichocladium antarcticum]
MPVATDAQAISRALCAALICSILTLPLRRGPDPHCCKPRLGGRLVSLARRLIHRCCHRSNDPPWLRPFKLLQAGLPAGARRSNSSLAHQSRLSPPLPATNQPASPASLAETVSLLRITTHTAILTAHSGRADSHIGARCPIRPLGGYRRRTAVGQQPFAARVAGDAIYRAAALFVAQNTGLWHLPPLPLLGAHQRILAANSASRPLRNGGQSRRRNPAPRIVLVCIDAVPEAVFPEATPVGGRDLFACLHEADDATLACYLADPSLSGICVPAPPTRIKSSDCSWEEINGWLSSEPTPTA